MAMPFVVEAKQPAPLQSEVDTEQQVLPVPAVRIAQAAQCKKWQAQRMSQRAVRTPLAEEPAQCTVWQEQRMSQGRAVHKPPAAEPAQCIVSALHMSPLVPARRMLVECTAQEPVPQLQADTSAALFQHTVAAQHTQTVLHTAAVLCMMSSGPCTSLGRQWLQGLRKTVGLHTSLAAVRHMSVAQHMSSEQRMSRVARRRQVQLPAAHMLSLVAHMP